MAQRVKGAPPLQSIKSLPVGYAFDLNKSEAVNHRMASNAAVSKNEELSSEANGNADGYIDESPYGRLNFSVEESPSSCDDDLRTNAFTSSKWSDTTSYVTKKVLRSIFNELCLVCWYYATCRFEVSVSLMIA